MHRRRLQPGTFRSTAPAAKSFRFPIKLHYLPGFSLRFWFPRLYTLKCVHRNLKRMPQVRFAVAVRLAILILGGDYPRRPSRGGDSLSPHAACGDEPSHPGSWSLCMIRCFLHSMFRVRCSMFDVSDSFTEPETSNAQHRMKEPDLGPFELIPSVIPDQWREV
jgi:hypothetical protein